MKLLKEENETLKKKLMDSERRNENLEERIKELQEAVGDAECMMSSIQAENSFYENATNQSFGNADTEHSECMMISFQAANTAPENAAANTTSENAETEDSDTQDMFASFSAANNASENADN